MKLWWPGYKDTFESMWMDGDVVPEGEKHVQRMSATEN